MAVIKGIVFKEYRIPPTGRRPIKSENDKNEPFARTSIGKFFVFSLIVTLDISNVSSYYNTMIATFKCRDTEALFNGRRIARFSGIETVAMRKLALLNVAVRIEDLRVPPGNRLEALKGKRQGQWSIRINAQWRVCFRFEGGNALDVEIVDYH